MFNAVIDLSHHNPVPSFEAVRNDGIAGVIHKATQGTSYADPEYRQRKVKAKAAGLLLGAYHFGTAGDVAGQADHFLSVVNPKEELLVLDFEADPQGPDMSLHEAEQFVHHVFSVTGKYPGLYGGYAIQAALAANGVKRPGDTELSKCWLWIARWSSVPPLLPKDWGQWTLWQYTDGASGPLPHTVASIGRCDRDQFNGTEAELRAFWARNLAV